MLSTRDLITAPKAAPITTATARSITLPRRMNCLKPLSMGQKSSPIGVRRRSDHVRCAGAETRNLGPSFFVEGGSYGSSRHVRAAECRRSSAAGGLSLVEEGDQLLNKIIRKLFSDP